MAPPETLPPQDDWIEPVTCNMPPLTVVEPLYKFVPLSVNVPPLLLTRFTRPRAAARRAVADHPGETCNCRCC